jgi:hypothetical protein
MFVYPSFLSEMFPKPGRNNSDVNLHRISTFPLNLLLWRLKAPPSIFYPQHPWEEVSFKLILPRVCWCKLVQLGGFYTWNTRRNSLHWRETTRIHMTLGVSYPIRPMKSKRNYTYTHDPQGIVPIRPMKSPDIPDGSHLDVNSAKHIWGPHAGEVEMDPMDGDHNDNPMAQLPLYGPHMFC